MPKDLEEIVYMSQPLEFEAVDQNLL